MEIIKIPLADITPDPHNAKDHPAEQIEQIKNSIQQFGNNDPIAVWGDQNLIVEGHGRYEALKALGYKEAECIRLDWLTEEERRAYALAHNQTTLSSGWDLPALDWNLESIGDIDMRAFGFGNRHAEWFGSGDTGEAREDEEEYAEFLEKFEPKHTTDDCYTPPSVYDAVADWVANEYGISRKNFVRPFYPGGDYQGEIYKKTDIVVDNPPFSIMKGIIDFYNAHGVRFFLFAPCLALFNYLDDNYGVCGICVQASVTYANGAVVPTSFLTNLDPCRARTAGDLYQSIKAAVDEIRKEQSRELPKYSYPDEVATAAMLGKYSHYGVELKIARSDSVRIRELDEQKEQGKAIYNCGLLLSERAAAERAAAERAAAERAAAERAAAERWHLSAREREIVKTLGH